MQGAAVLCHPHPAFGGTMDVWLLPVLARALADAGWWALRFDLRGVGASEGTTDDGREAVADVLGAVDHVVAVAAGASARSQLRRAVVGWSFGATLALHAAVADDAIADWIGICPPTRVLPDVPMLPPVPQGLEAACTRRTAVVAEHDAFYPPGTVGAVVPHRTVVVQGADHFLFDRDAEVAAIVVAALGAP